MPHIRPLLMGEAYVAVADEASVILYNPAGLDTLRASEVDLFTPQVAFNEPLKLALIDPDKFSNKLDKVSQDLEDEKYETLLGRSFFADLSIRTPFVVFPDKGLAFGLGAEGLGNLVILPNRVVPLVRVEFFLDKVLLLGGFGHMGPYLSWGFNLKVIDRIGVDRTYTAGDIIATADTGGSITDRPEWQDVKDGVSFTVGGLDLGLLFRFPGGGDWQPRLGLSLLNIGGYDSKDGLQGMEFGPRQSEFEPPQAGELPEINTIGVAVSPSWLGIRFTFAADMVDFTRTAMPGKDYGKRLRVGTEIGFFPHSDGTARLSLLAGWRGGHSSYGVLSRVWIFEVGFGVYSVELGDRYGDFPDHRTIFTLGFRF